MRSRLLLASFGIVVFGASLSASWLSDITGINVDLTSGRVEIGTPRPQAIPDMLSNLPKDVAQTFLAPHGQALASLIRQANNQARGAARPIPQEIASQLSPYFPPHVMARAKWAPTDPNRFSLDTLRNMLQEGAITLDDIIVFTDSQYADPQYFNPRNREIRRLWAHELTHVMQYTNMGIESFATIYSVNWESLESQARSWADRVEGELEARDSSPGQPMQNFYSGSSSRPSRFIGVNDYSSAAKQYFPAASCVAGQQVGPQQLWLNNRCPIPIFIAETHYMHPYFGLQRQPCVANCGIAPGATIPYMNTAPGQVVNVLYRY